MVTESQLKIAFEIIGNELTQVWLFFYAAKHLHQANLYGNLRYFSAAIYSACIDNAALVFSRLMFKPQSSFTLHFLFDLAEKQPELFPYASPEQLKKSITEHRAKLQTYTELLETLETQRDKMLAHLDLKHITDPDAIRTIPLVNFTELENCLQDVRLIFNTYHIYFNDTELGLSHIERNIQEDIQHLVTLIAEAEQRD